MSKEVKFFAVLMTGYESPSVLDGYPGELSFPILGSCPTAGFLSHRREALNCFPILRMSYWPQAPRNSQGTSINSCKKFLSIRWFLSFKLPRTVNYQKPYVNIFHFLSLPLSTEKAQGLGIPVSIIKINFKKASTCLLVIQRAIITELDWTCVYIFC